MNIYKSIPTPPNPDDMKPQGPVKLFDDLYFIGNKVVGSWVIPTSEGIVLIEASAEADHWEKVLKPGLDEIGLGSEKILALLLTHGHMDHYGGSDHIMRATGCDVCLSAVDAVYMNTRKKNIRTNKESGVSAPMITRIIAPGDELVFGDHVISVLDGAGHSPGCLNYSMEVHDNGEPHRFIMMGGYGVFGTFEWEDVQTSVMYALKFASTCVNAWEYAKAHNCDIFFNPHPHLCNMYQTAEENKNRKPGDPNAFVIGRDGVRQWIMERFDACMASVVEFSDIRKPFVEE